MEWGQLSTGLSDRIRTQNDVMVQINMYVYAAMITGYTLKSLVYSLSHPSILYSILSMERIKMFNSLYFSPNLAKTEFSKPFQINLYVFGLELHLMIGF